MRTQNGVDRGIRRSRKMARGATIVDSVAGIAAVTVLAGVLLPSAAAVRSDGKLAACLHNLSRIGSANQTYAIADPSEAAIPVHAAQFTQDPENPTYIGAYEWGGKSGIGWEDWLDPPNPLSSRYGTKAGFGPATRPLNSILYPHGFRDNLNPAFNRVGAQLDTRLQLNAFRCPADDGPPGGAHCPQWLANPLRSSYDHFGTSYAANVFMISSSGGGPMLSNSPYLRPIIRVPNPARTINYEENIGRWAWACRRELSGCEFVGPGVDPGPTKAVRGWHGKDWTFNRAFVDAHADTQAVYIEGTEDDEGYANHYRNQQLPAYPNWAGCEACPPGSKDCTGLSSEGSFEEYRCIIVRGEGWQKDTMPAPFVCTGLYWGGGGRPSYENCVVPGGTLSSAAEAGMR